MSKPVLQDERTIAVENAAAKLTLGVVSWLLVIDLGLHGLIPDKINPGGFPLDIFFICLVSGTVNLLCKWKGQAMTSRSVAAVVIALAAGILVSAGLVALMSKY